MPFTLTMPKLSPTMEEGTIAKWHKKEGDFVAAGELVLEITTDKATVEHQALDEGWLRKRLIPEGGTARVNQPIAIFTEQEAENIEDYLPKKPEPLPSKQADRDETALPKQEKEMVKAASAPTLSQPAFVPEPPLSAEPSLFYQEKAPPISPLAKRLAKEQGLDLTSLQGSGPGGRITSRDLSKAQPAGVVTFGRKEAPTATAGSYEEVPLSSVRKVIARRLQEAKSFIPHFYIKQSIDAEPLYALREQLKAYQLKVTYNDMIIKACALALRQHPQVNAGFNSVNQTIIQFKTVDISVAVTVEAGLITPIIRHADYKNLGQISLEVKELAERARALKLKEHEYKGGSFCVSNLGMFGISEFTAVINPPQAAILAVGAIEEQPVVKEGKIAIGKRLTLTLSLDHRVIDGALGAQFIKSLQLLLEHPAALIF